MYTCIYCSQLSEVKQRAEEAAAAASEVCCHGDGVYVLYTCSTISVRYIHVYIRLFVHV